MDELRPKFQRYVDDSAKAMARDLASLLNRALDLGAAICPDVDRNEGTTYSIEWNFGGSHHLDVEYDAHANQWVVKGPDDA